ncbi:MAG TPA: helix-turn-helix domain-containing protein [Steroidobacteraceae bacterium]|jgi:AcrR family transcriptional regulator|nr:helix-turn-helix domain-containing protein [Steroidobacteraceae bacterium]
MSPKAKRNGEESSGTREAILDATARIMRDEGYAAVSSRRVANAAGLKSQLVHYHFGTMDDLFLALFQRAEAQHLERHMQAFTSANPVRELWALSIDRTGMELIFEFMALANHRPAIRRELARASERTRAMQIVMLKRMLQQLGISSDICPPNVLSLLIAGLARALVSEAAIGVSSAHADTLAFVERMIQKAERGRLGTRRQSRSATSRSSRSPTPVSSGARRAKRTVRR